MPDDPPTPNGPPILTRQELRKQARGSSHVWWYVLGGAAVVLIGVVVAVLLAGKKSENAAKAAATTTVAPAAAAICPLTGAPAPGGTVPARPALGVKIGNYSGDRPSAGLNQADIVFEEPVEGAITRLVAVFQCQSTSLVGDLRSAREPDAAILSQFSHPIFVHAGGIRPVLALMAASPLTDENLLDGSGSTIIHPPGRVAPYSTFANTAALWALDSSDTAPPAPIFTYSATLPAGSVPGSGASVHIPFSSSSDVTWRWNPKAGNYLRFYSGEPDRLLDGSQTAATNVVIMSVQTYTGPWVENSEGGLEVNVTYSGAGPLVVVRNGVAITGTWSRSSLTQPATFTTTGGAPITLQPGNTWEELVPDGITVTTTSAPAPASATPTTRAP
ncbi:MAG: DUF3048 domain-containing protein [Acidimicrobiales bacterium]